ncbi:Rne/Rng family ribonuclease [Nonomuraea sp. LP-02]|uniref:Rne/Rng family ribonuclease n=1 Tax=Nonomuraea sp. LP-02 TaxID=3097960 RepID=UPI002E35C3F4|nr:Rne/Rng family ribonuclease [Nonomuraea sp. LP-02]MED7930928.1 Rne/Rng family ribonuclease [Nonomuraea sp. LP-02]
MLDNEPNAGATGPDGETTEQTTGTRRRRAASRPAGPPPELPEEPVQKPVTVVAAQAAPSVSVSEGAPVRGTVVRRAAGSPDAEVAVAVENGSGAVSGARGAGGGVAEAGGIGAAEAVGGPAAGAGVSPVEAAVAGAVADAVSEAGAGEEKPKKTSRTRSTATTTRRRTTKKGAEAEEAGAESGAGVAVSAEGAGAGAVESGVAAAPAEEVAPKRRTRTRKKAGEDVAAEAVAPAGEQGVPADGATEAAAGQAAGVSAAGGVGAGPVGAEGAGQAAAQAAGEAGTQAGAEAEAQAEAAESGRGTGSRRTRTRATTTRSRRATAAEAAPGETGEDAGTGPQGAVPGQAGAGQGAVAGGVQGPVVASGGDVEGLEDEGEDIIEILPEDEPLDDEPAGEDLDEEPTRPSLLADPFGLSARRYDEPGAAFQRPAAIFAPLFQAPDPTQAKPAVTRRPEPPQPVEPEEAEDLVEEGVEDETDADAVEEPEEEEGGGRRRRRRRGGRGRGKSRERGEGEDGEDQDEESEEEPAEEPSAQEEEESSSSRRRRRRRRRGGDEGAEPASDDPPNTVVRIRAPRSGRTGALETATDGVQSVRGSTRLEAKKQRRREGRELGRRRPPIITESEFLARRESVDRMMVVRRQGDRTQIAVLEDGVLVEHYVNREASQSYVGNVYLGKVQNVLPSMEAAFVDIGKGRNAVLYAGEVNFDTVGMEGQPKRIESALKSGQSVLVQVTKDPIGHKGARLTSQISLPGRYLVYVPDGSMTGISRKLPDKERTRLKSILKKVMPENAGVIVRTAAEGASEDELARDVARLSAQWESIQKKAKSASPPELLSAEPDLTIRVIRDVFNEDFTNLVVQGDDAWDTVDDYVKYVAPHLGERLSKWDGEQGDVFEAYRIDEQLGKALERKVWLPSGGSLVIDRTEAMTVVDVNTGKFTGQGGNLEETVTRNNLEAAEEIVRQLRLRDIGGIIVIDFIDMVLESNRDLVLRRMLECLARDRTKHQVAEVTSLGLVQMTRKRVGQGLLEAFSTPCECCNGRGLIVSTEPVESKPEPRGTQGKMAVEKAVSDKVSAAKDTSGRDTVTGALDDVPAEDDQAGQTSGRGRRRSRRAKSAD